ncbi:2-hydroxyacyl-CoA lyase 2-like [Neocloeon triangulifer]|uniref:2-hydroxyacyl-CoA lyase 2-like n=1 Tax=Neocloeon triangulifer TaxID=2078957 RepID=UPI00286F7515|nr:2-hydroxyacyl-CoA lyase 2-like [Neocloeon triangulifer]
MDSSPSVEEGSSSASSCYNKIFFACGFLGVCAGLLVRKLNLVYIWKHKVDATSKRNGGELVAEVLKSHGVKFLFTLAGGHISPILVAAEKLGLRVVDTRHEVNAVFAADAVSRLSRTVGVAAVTAGPGVTNTVTAVKNAQLAESPLLLIGGAAAGILKGRGALQDIDQINLFHSICKYSATVKTVRDIVPTLRKALHEAQSGTPGPVFVEFPLDVLYPYDMVKRELFNVPPPKSFASKVINWYMNNYLSNLFSGAWEPVNTTPIEVQPLVADTATMQKCVEALSKSKKPVFVIGSQALLPPNSVENLKKALETLGVPCYLSGMARGLLGRKSDIQMRHHRGDALKEADLIILAGAVCDFRLSYGRSLSKSATIIAINRDKDQLHKNAGIFWKPTFAVQADPSLFLFKLAMCLCDYKCDDAWLSKLRERDAKKDEKNEKMSLEPTTKYLNPMKILCDLDKFLPDDAILVADGGDFVGTAAYILRPRGPLQWLDPGAFGTLGVGGGFALGAKLCRPDAPVWIIWGDGSSGYSIAEFDTFRRHNVPVIGLIGNDACWTQIAREQVPMFGTSVACNLSHCDYHIVAEGYGGKGILLSDSTKSNTEVFEEATKLNKEGHSVLINALIGTTKFREGSISI